ncbi:starch-binding associating with outer membrane [Elysia marginata]|uniref:Starch-binding associating with outer membrane n=1 Tax=Elysia marginata TaxID=1093978 RepID=A0AAV4FX16_9GAST|nr:starch-binding associating with outer membrane [Elysia marginata]
MVVKAQSLVSGIVSDENGQVLFGVSVFEKGTSNGTQTDQYGSYSISVAQGSILVFSYIGYKKKEIRVTKKLLNINLIPDDLSLNEVVVVGFGSKKKGELTGSVAKLDSKAFENRPITDVKTTLQGTLPGVLITRNSGQPGASGSIQIRGLSSINGSPPLVLVDGIARGINSVNPTDIESVTVLRDASAAIYGSRASGGVILITTKSGAKGDPTVTYAMNVGFKTPSFMKKMVNTFQLASMRNEYYRSFGKTGKIIPKEVFDKIKANAPVEINNGWAERVERFPGFYGSRDWAKVIFGDSFQQNHNLSVSGGGEFNSCTKDLDLLPLSELSDPTFWKKAEDFQLGANSLYNSLESFQSDVDSDIAFSSGNSISQGDYQSGESSWTWNNAYALIRRANNMMEKATKFKDDDAIKRYAAEARFFRAYNYWRLFRLYGGVPLIKKVLNTESKELFKSRATMGATADFILLDLDKASALLPESVGAEEVGRITKWAANAMRARVALFMGTWAKYHGLADENKYLDIAIESSKAVIESGQYELFKLSDEIDSYFKLFVEEGDDSKESILDRRYLRNISEHGLPYRVHDGYIGLPTKKLADMYLCVDGLPIEKSNKFKGYGTPTSEYDHRDPRMEQTMYRPGKKIFAVRFPDKGVECWPFFPQKIWPTGYAYGKYLSRDKDSNSRVQGGKSHFYDHHIIRYAEVLLIYAESLFEKNGSVSDVELDASINLIRDRVGMPRLTNDFVIKNNMNMKDEIHRERTVELALEGFRYDDLRRWKTAEVELPKAIRGIKVKGSDWEKPFKVPQPGKDKDSIKNPYREKKYQENTDAGGFLIVEDASKRQFDPKKHYLRPLPTKEIRISKGQLKQNPGW